jgi:hypothetical protein
MAAASKPNAESTAKRQRQRKRHIQQSLFRHGGKRRGAGRPARGPRSSAPHKTRPEVEAKNVLHVVLRARPEVGNLRRREILVAAGGLETRRGDQRAVSD